MGTTKAISIHELAVHRGLKTDDSGAYSMGDIAMVGLDLIGGCEGCGACIAAYNAYPSKTGNWRCSDCIGDYGYETVEQANLEIFGVGLEESFVRGLTGRELATILHGLRMIQCEGRLEGCAAGDCEHFDGAEALNNQEIDALCERLNCATLESNGDPMDVAATVLPEAVRGSEAWEASGREPMTISPLEVLLLAEKAEVKH
jgi:hypothetical protein